MNILRILGPAFVFTTIVLKSCNDDRSLVFTLFFATYSATVSYLVLSILDYQRLISSPLSSHIAHMERQEEPIYKYKDKVVKESKGGVRMPRLFRYAMYFMLLMLMWKFVSNIEHIANFLIDALRGVI